MIPKIKPITDKNLRRWIWQERDKTCLFCSESSQDPHHIIRQSHKRLDLAWNMFGVCRRCHKLIDNRTISPQVEVSRVNKRLEELGYTERFRADTGRIRLDIGLKIYQYL